MASREDAEKWIASAPAGGLREIRNAALEEAAVAAEALDRSGREWVADSLWASWQPRQLEP